MSSGKFSRGESYISWNSSSCVNADAGLAGEVICATTVYRTQAASTVLAMLRGNATVSTDGADFSAIKVLLYTYTVVHC